MTAYTFKLHPVYPTLAGVLWQRRYRTDSGRVRNLLRAVVLAVAGSALLALSAQVEIPLYPVPVTLQTLAVLVIGFAYGWRLASFTVLLYLVEGAAGLPVFAGGGGLGVLVGPTGGYLAGFVAAAAACGFLAEHGWDRRATSTFAAMLLGNLLIYASGLLWLGFWLGWDKPILQWGFYPFIIGDLVKIAAAVLLLPAAWKLVGKSPKAGTESESES